MYSKKEIKKRLERSALGGIGAPPKVLQRCGSEYQSLGPADSTQKKIAVIYGQLCAEERRGTHGPDTHRDRMKKLLCRLLSWTVRKGSVRPNHCSRDMVYFDRDWNLRFKEQ